MDSSSPVEISSASGQGDTAHAITFWRAVLIPVSSDQVPTIGHSYINNNDNHWRKNQSTVVFLKWFHFELENKSRLALSTGDRCKKKTCSYFGYRLTTISVKFSGAIIKKFFSNLLPMYAVHRSIQLPPCTTKRHHGDIYDDPIHFFLAVVGK